VFICWKKRNNAERVSEVERGEELSFGSKKPSSHAPAVKLSIL
jgi:hypothetical protein